MRIWGRVYAEDGTYEWVKVETAADGSNDNVRVTQLIQVLKLYLNESPFYAQYGIPAERSVVTQVFPDYYAYQTQALFSKYFSSLQISKQNSPTPTYKVDLIKNNGAPPEEPVPV